MAASNRRSTTRTPTKKPAARRSTAAAPAANAVGGVTVNYTDPDGRESRIDLPTGTSVETFVRDQQLNLSKVVVRVNRATSNPTTILNNEDRVAITRTDMKSA